LSSYKAPSFQDRIAAAGSAKQKALDALRAKPPVDAALSAERRQAQEAREQAAAAKRAAKLEAIALAKAEKAERKAAIEAAEALKAARLTPAGAAEMKAARDARYAARKARKK
jgi:hypothetical protein